MYFVFLYQSIEPVVLFININLCWDHQCTEDIRVVEILLSTPNRVYGLHLKGVGCNTPERLLLHPMRVYS